MSALSTIRTRVSLARRMNSEAVQWKIAGFANVARLFQVGRDNAMADARMYVNRYDGHATLTALRNSP